MTVKAEVGAFETHGGSVQRERERESEKWISLEKGTRDERAEQRTERRDPKYYVLRGTRMRDQHWGCCCLK